MLFLNDIALLKTDISSELFIKKKIFNVMNYEDTAEKEVLYSKFSMIPSITAKANSKIYKP